MTQVIDDLRAMSFTQPWASLVAFGEKKFETRPRKWPAGIYLIHASKGWTKEDQALVWREPFRSALLRHDIFGVYDVPRAAILGAMELGPATGTEDAVKTISDVERAFGNYTPGRFAFPILRALSFPEPILNVLGALGPWRVPAEIVEKVNPQLSHWTLVNEPRIKPQMELAL